MAPMGRKKKDKSKVDRNEDSGSSTPPSSPPSVDDDKQRLLQTGACGSSDKKESKSPVKSTGEAKNTASGKGSTYRQSLDAPESDSTADKDRLFVPYLGSDVVDTGSPRKKSRFLQLKDKLSPKKNSPNTTPVGSESGLEDNLAADPKRKLAKRPNESKQFSSNIPPTDYVETSSVSNPSAEVYPDATDQSEHSSEKRHLAPPGKDIGTDSPSKKNLWSQLKKALSPKKNTPNLSPVDSDPSCVDGNPPESERKRKANAENKSQKQSKSETSSSSASPIVSKKTQDSDVSNTLSPNTADYDPREGTSSDTVDYTQNSRRPSLLDNMEAIRNQMKRDFNLKNQADSHGKSVDTIRLIVEDMDAPYSEEEGNDPNQDSRRRSRSFNSNVRVRVENVTRSLRNLDLGHHLDKPRDDSVQSDASWSDPSGRRDQEGWSENRSHLYIQRGFEAAWSDQSVRRKDRRHFDTRLGAEAATSDPSVRRKDAEIRRNNRSDAERGATVARPHSFTGRLHLQPQLDDDDREVLRRAEAAGPVPSVRRYQSLSPRPLDACQCGSSYIHEIGCSREIKARRRRIQRRCRQAVYLGDTDSESS